MSIALAVHGGAWNVPDADLADHLDGIADVLRSAWLQLQHGANALDVVSHAVQLLEDDPRFNAGTGSHLNRRGAVELDASIMEGNHLRAGAVAAVERVRNPIRLARAVLEHSEHVLLVADGARQFADEQGIATCDETTLLVGRARETYLRIRSGETTLVDEEFSPSHPDPHMGTVGAVARDATGLIVAGTSTGGTLNKYPGRVGDSPLIGSGTYADSRRGGASCTGWGEGIMRTVLAKSATDRLASQNDVSKAASGALVDLENLGGHAGLILIGTSGEPVSVFNTPRMVRGLATHRGGLRTGGELDMQPLQ
ncbi:MAG: peptidase T [Chromatiales bacterium]|nr:peptidase T [Chromatiales bacterium]